MTMAHYESVALYKCGSITVLQYKSVAKLQCANMTVVNITVWQHDIVQI